MLVFVYPHCSSHKNNSRSCSVLDALVTENGLNNMQCYNKFNGFQFITVQPPHPQQRRVFSGSSRRLQLAMFLFHFIPRSFVSGRVAPNISDSSFSGIVCICACLYYSEQQHFVVVGVEGKNKMAVMSCSSALQTVSMRPLSGFVTSIILTRAGNVYKKYWANYFLFIFDDEQSYFWKNGGNNENFRDTVPIQLVLILYSELIV